MNKKVLLAAIALGLVVGIMAGVWFVTRPKPVEGEKTITVTVIHKDGSEKVFTYQTDEEYLGKLLYDEGLVIADENNAGMFHTVDGEKADFSADQSYWALYVGQEYAQTGIEQTPIQDGDSFRLVYTVYEEG